MLVPSSELGEAIARLVSAAKAYVVDSDAAFVAACDDLRAVKGLQKAVKAGRDSALEPGRAHQAAVDGYWKPLVDGAALAETQLKAKTEGYRAAQERKRREEEARAREAARREQERLAKQAAAAEAKGRTERAELLREQAAMVPATVVPPAPAVPKADGISFREYWQAEVFDFSALVAAVAAGAVPLAALKPDDTFLRKQAEALHEEMRYPGVRVSSRTGSSARSA